MISVRLPQLAFLFVAATAPVAAVTIGFLNVANNEDFNTLASAVPGTSSALPTGWALLETGSAANLTYATGTGSSATGDTYSFGSAAVPGDRAFGTLQSGSVVSTIGTIVTNATGGPITSLTISYVGEQWRLGTTGRTDQLDFSYSTNATGLSGGTWIDANQLDFVTPNTGAATGLLDGNAGANRTAISFTLTGLNLGDGASLWLRWSDFGASGADDGLAIDDFSITAGGQAQNTPDGLPLAFAAVLFGGLFLGASRHGKHA